MKIINQYVVKYQSQLAFLYEVEGNKFYVKFTGYTDNGGWKEQIKELPAEEAAGLIA